MMAIVIRQIHVLISSFFRYRQNVVSYVILTIYAVPINRRSCNAVFFFFFFYLTRVYMCGMDHHQSINHSHVFEHFMLYIRNMLSFCVILIEFT